MELSGRSILLTGASGGIGRATAEILAREGVRLTLAARRAEPLESLRSRLPGASVHIVTADIRRAEDAERAVAEAEISDAAFAGMLETNVMGTFRMTRAALSSLAKRPGAVIVNVGSFAGKVGVPYYSFYNASKFALVGLSEGWRRELGPKGIQVALVLPAAVDTEFLDGLGRNRALGTGPASTVLTAQDVARGIVGALKRPRPEIYIPGRNRWFAILNVLMPSLADRVMNRLYRYPGGTG